jgi:general secretion pathway protein G
MNQLRGGNGFTLIEMVVVMFIIGLLASLVGPAILGSAEDAKRKAAKAQVQRVAQSIRIFALDTGRLPTAAEGLRVLIPPPPES